MICLVSLFIQDQADLVDITIAIAVVQNQRTNGTNVMMNQSQNSME
jgi:hypothetical protein